MVALTPALPSNEHTAAKIEFDSAQYFTKKMFQCLDIEELCQHRPKDDRRVVTVTVTDPDANKFNESIDRVKVFVWSDTDPKGITITAHETHVNSGIFSEQFLITDDISGIGRIHVRDGDTLSAKYIDDTVPAEYDSGSFEVVATSFVGIMGVPIERAPAQNLHVVDKAGNTITSSQSGEQVQIVCSLQNRSFSKLPFSYIVQIQNQNGTSVYLSWIEGTMTPKQNLKPSLSWIPQDPGTYTIWVFVWESVQNPTALSAPISMDMEIKN